jgi:branched-chain amino acid transport system ATP-binding protein
MLQVTDLETYHGRIRAVNRVSLHVNEGEIVSIIGANGAGKSTLLGTLAGLYRPARGEVRLGGERLDKLPPNKVVRKGLSLVPEGRQIFSTLTVRENLVLGMYHKYRKEKKMLEPKIEAMMELFPGLKKHYKNVAGNMSGGEQQMLAIARGLMSDPKVILLDEPSMGLAPMIVKEILDTLRRIRDEMGTMVLLVEQNVKAALKVGDRAYVMDRGQFVLEGKAADLLNDPQVQSTYLGHGRAEEGA